MRQVEHLIIGSGLAGLVLARMLGARALVLDPCPAAYKIGESLIPELFRHPALAQLLPRVLALPSFSPKDGTSFVSGDQVVYFPLPPGEAERSMHVARGELEQMMIDAWAIEVTRARVTAIDWASKVVTTSAGPIAVSGLILDCSGPAMVVATLRGEVAPLRPVFATWGYHDVVARDDGAWRRRMAAEGRGLALYDARHRRILADEEALAWAPTRTTLLTRIGEGQWTWQIPLAGQTRMSVGVVSRHGPVDEATYRRLAAEHASPDVTLRGPRVGGDGPFDRLHRRDHFARRARVPAGRDFILLADAAMFSDPVYSVGAGLAVSQALDLAALLTGEGWSPAACEAHCDRVGALLRRAEAAFDFWYSGALLRDPASAAEVQEQFLRGEVFRSELSAHYGALLADSEHAGGRPRYAPLPGAAPLDADAGALLGAGALHGWALVGADRCDGGVALRFRGGEGPMFTVIVGRAGAGRCYREVGPLALSYMRGAAAEAGELRRGQALLEAVTARLAAGPDRWLALLDG